MAAVRYYIVLDFEATCQDGDRSWPKEIIEFPAVLLDARTLRSVDEFRQMVRPVERPQLTPFCTKLTSIRQDEVDGADALEAVIDSFSAWLDGHGLLSEPAAALTCTCGDWDLMKQLPQEFARKRLRVHVPQVLQRWCNLKKAFSWATGRPPVDMDGMLRAMRLPLLGHHHLGIDDCRNLARLSAALVERMGNDLWPTGWSDWPRIEEPPSREQARPGMQGKGGGGGKASGKSASMKRGSSDAGYHLDASAAPHALRHGHPGLRKGQGKGEAGGKSGAGTGACRADDQLNAIFQQSWPVPGATQPAKEGRRWGSSGGRIR